MTARQAILSHAAQVGAFKLSDLNLPYDEARLECGRLVAKGLLVTLFRGRPDLIRYTLAKQPPFAQLDVAKAVRKCAIIKLQAECWACRQAIRSCG